MSEQFDAALDAAFPDRQVESVERQDARPGNVTGRVTFAGGGRAYLKTATDGDRRLVRETAALRYAGTHCPVETPTVVAAAPHADPPYLTTDPLPGTALAERWGGDADRAALLRQAGHLLAGVHEARFDRHGVVAGGDADALELATDAWPATLQAVVEERAADLFADRFADLPPRLVELLGEAAPLLADAPAALLHGDPSRPNCRLDPPGLLDWERALVGDPALEVTDAVGHLVDQPDVPEERRADLRDALYAGYRERAGGLPDGLDARRPVYRAVAYLLVPQTFELWAPQVDRPTGDLAAWVREEFDDRLSRARDAVEAANP